MGAREKNLGGARRKKASTFVPRPCSLCSRSHPRSHSHALIRPLQPQPAQVVVGGNWTTTPTRRSACGAQPWAVPVSKQVRMLSIPLCRGGRPTSSRLAAQFRNGYCDERPVDSEERGPEQIDRVRIASPRSLAHALVCVILFFFSFLSFILC